MSFIKNPLLLFLGVISQFTLIACNQGVQSGSVNSTFAGVQSATAISPTAVKLTWAKKEGIREYKVYEASSNTPLATTIFNSTVIENLTPNRDYVFKVVGSDGSVVYGIDVQTDVKTWPRFEGVTSISSPTSDSMLVSWEYDRQPTSYNVFVGTGTLPTATNTNNWTNFTAQTPLKSYVITNVQPSKKYYVVVHANYREGEKEITTKSISLTSGVTFKTPDYYLSPISIGSFPFINVTPKSDATHIASAFKSQAFWNGGPVTDPLNGPGTMIFSSTAGIPIGQVGSISLSFQYGAGATLESQTIEGLSTYVKGVASQFESPATNLPQGASYFGKALAHGDFNCDGADDLAVGVPDIALAQFGSRNPNVGAVFIYYSKNMGDHYELQTSPAPAVVSLNPGVNPQILTFDDFYSDTKFGTSLSGGNFNGDKNGLNACDDLAVGAPGFYEPIKGYVGGAFVFFGSTTGLKAPSHASEIPVNSETCDGLLEGSTCVAVRFSFDYSLIPNGLASGTYDPYNGLNTGNGFGGWEFGASVKFIGDFDANGYTDLAIGAPSLPWPGNIPGYGSSNGYLTNVGGVFVYGGSRFGSGLTSYNSTYSLRMIPIMPPVPEQNMRFGASIGGGADVDGKFKMRAPDLTLQGGADMIIGAPNFTYQDYVTKNILATNIGTSPSNSIVMTPNGLGWLPNLGAFLTDTLNYYLWPQNSNTQVGAAFLYFGNGGSGAAGGSFLTDNSAWLACGNRGMPSTKHFSCLANQNGFKMLIPRDAGTRNFGSAVALIGNKSRFLDNTNTTVEPGIAPTSTVPATFYSDTNQDGFADIIVAASGSTVAGKNSVGQIYEFFGNNFTTFSASASDFYNLYSDANPASDTSINSPTCSIFSSNSVPVKRLCKPNILNSSSLSSGAALGSGPAQLDIGDVTGDGLGDIVIGASGENTTGLSSGAVLVYTSSASLGVTPSYKKFYGSQTAAGHRLGSSVTVGNFNGDLISYVPGGTTGYAGTIRPLGDVFAGSPFDGSGSPSIGTVNGFMTSLTSNPPIGFPLPSILGSTTDGRGGQMIIRENQASFTLYGLGESTIVGDVNGDGYADAISKIMSFDNLGNRVVDAVVYFGSPIGLITKDFCLTNKNRIFLNASTADSACYPSTAPLVGVTLNSIALPQLIPRPNNLSRIWFVKASNAGDLNNDGFADVIFYGAETTVYYGARGGLSNVEVPNYSPSAIGPQIISKQIVYSDNIGYGNNGGANDLGGYVQSTLVSTGDFNGDGFSDVIIGEPSAPSLPMNTTGTTAFLPHDNDPTNPSPVTQGTGWACGATTDPQCLAGAAVPNYGAIYVIYGSERGLQTPSVLGLTVPSDFSKGSVGTVDMISTEGTNNICTVNPGAASTCKVGYIRNPVWENVAYGYNVLVHNFGANVSVLKLDNDSYDDALVGAPGFTDVNCASIAGSAVGYGRIYAFYGSSGGLVASVRDDYYNWRRNNTNCPVRPGSNSITDDPAGGLIAGKSRVRALSPGIANPTQNKNYRFFGLNVAAIGDINGDGFEDFAASNPNEAIPNSATTFSYPGAIYVFYGPLCPLDTHVQVDNWYQADLLSGVNHIGIQTYYQGAKPVTVTTPNSEFAGVPGADLTAINSCLRSSTLGYKPLPVKFTVLGTNEAVGDRFGYAMSSARKGKGDFNGDGIDDLLIGSWNSDDSIANLTGSGRGVVFFGSSVGISMNEYPTITLSNSADGRLRPFLMSAKNSDNNAYFYRGNLSSGDVNRDGTVDYMLTSRYHNGSGSTRGIRIGTFFIFY